MDFFSLQDKARNQTRVLAFLFLLAVVLITVAINLLLFFAVSTQMSVSLSFEQWLGQPYWLYVSAGVITLILLTSFWRSWQLNTSPSAIAKMVNATRVDLNSPIAEERRLVNVVEEMSIASGVPIPKIHIMKHERGINAFVAGLEPDAITLVVTQGLLEKLDRQELQGVIAHEYSHVFHGDMRINVRLIGILAGILVIGQLGQMLLRAGPRDRFGKNKNSGNAGLVIAIGVGLFTIGYIGLFFGRLIKAAISRQREFLADASAVQYTRDKEGICGALYKISQDQQGSLLQSDKAEEMSHLCFGQTIKQRFSGWMATHPPIRQRITALDTRFYSKATVALNSTDEKSTFRQYDTQLDDQFDQNRRSLDHQPIGEATLSSLATSNLTTSNVNASRSLESRANATAPPLPEAVLSTIGVVSPEHINEAQNLLAKIPDNLLQVARGKNEQISAGDFILALLISSRSQKSSARNNYGSNLSNKLTKLKELIEQLTRIDFRQQHALFELALTRIEQLAPQQRRELVTQLSQITNRSSEITLTEYMIYACTARRSVFLPKGERTKLVTRFKQIDNSIVSFFGALYRLSQLDLDAKKAEFGKKMKLLGINNVSLEQKNIPVQTLGKSLHQIARLHPLLKRDFMTLCVEIVENDNKIGQEEFELLRLLGEYLNCPLPISID